MKLFGAFALCICIIFNISCKKKKESQTDAPRTVIAYDTAFHQEAVVLYTPDASVPSLWENSQSIMEGTIMNTLSTEDGNIFIMVEMEKRYHFEHIYVLGLDTGGKILGEDYVKMPQNAKYELYESFLIPQKNGFPVYYVLKEGKNTMYVPDGNKEPEKVLLSLDSYSIDQLTFGQAVSRYQTKSISLKALLKNFVLDNQVSKFGSIMLRRYDGKIFLYGDARTVNDNWSGYPFVVLLTDDLKVIHSHIYNDEKYMYTDIKNIEVDKNQNITLTGMKVDGIDGSYYYTNMQFVVDKNLNFIQDQSDKEPHYSFYRGPSAPDYTDDNISEEDYEEEDSESSEEKTDNEKAVKEDTETQQPDITKTSGKTIEKLLYDKNKEKAYYVLTYDEKEQGEIILEKVNYNDSTVILKRIIDLPGKYLPVTACETPDGGMVLALTTKHKQGSGEDYEKDAFLSKALLLRFNKEGNLQHQFETPFYTGGITNLGVFTTKDNKLIVSFIPVNAHFDGDKWHYPQQLSIIAFPL